MLLLNDWEDEMGSIVCFIDKEGFSGTCDNEKIVDCIKCDFKKQFEGRENEEFSYCFWLGEIEERI